MPFGCPGTQRVAGATRWQVVAEVGIVEGTVRNIDNRHKEITVRFDSRTTETFQLTERAATVGEVQTPTGPDDVVIEFTGATGQRVSHPFRKKS